MQTSTGSLPHVRVQGDQRWRREAQGWSRTANGFKPKHSTTEGASQLSQEHREEMSLCCQIQCCFLRRMVCLSSIASKSGQPLLLLSSEMRIGRAYGYPLAGSSHSPRGLQVVHGILSDRPVHGREQGSIRALAALDRRACTPRPKVKSWTRRGLWSRSMDNDG